MGWAKYWEDDQDYIIERQRDREQQEEETKEGEKDRENA